MTRNRIRRLASLFTLYLALGLIITIFVAHAAYQSQRISWLRESSPVEKKRLQTEAVIILLHRYESTSLDRYSIGMFRETTKPPPSLESEKLLLRDLMDEFPPPSWVDRTNWIESMLDPSVVNPEYSHEGPTWMFDAAGWPSRCFRSRQFAASWNDVPTQWNTRYILAFGTTLWIPTGIIWFGLLKNVACFAAAAWCTIKGIGAVRALRRVRRGHCPRCDYDLTGQLAQGCPECGWNRAASAQRGQGA